MMKVCVALCLMITIILGVFVCVPAGQKQFSNSDSRNRMSELERAEPFVTKFRGKVTGHSYNWAPAFWIVEVHQTLQGIIELPGTVEVPICINPSCSSGHMDENIDIGDIVEVYGTCYQGDPSIWVYAEDYYMIELNASESNIEFPSITGGDLKSHLFVDRYEFKPDGSNPCVEISLISTKFDAKLYLYIRNPDSLIRQNDYVSPEFGSNAQILECLGGAFTYLIEVASSDSRSGSYKLVVRGGAPEIKRICNYIGHKYPAIYPGPTWDERQIASNPPLFKIFNADDWIAEMKDVGGDKCYGMCGARCKGGKKKWYEAVVDKFCGENRYTVDCLDHDYCSQKWGVLDERCMQLLGRGVSDCTTAERCGNSEDAAVESIDYPPNSNSYITATKSATIGPNVTVESGANITIAAPTVILKADTRSNRREGSAVGFHAKKGSYVNIKATLVSTNGLVAHYKLDGSATDSSGNGNDGTQHSMTYGVGNNDQAASFDGRTAYINIAKQLLSENDNFTISFWLKSSGVQDPLSVPISQGHGSMQGLAFQYGYPSQNSLSFIWGDGSAWRHLDFDCLKSDTTWHFLAATKDGNTISVFKDGNLHRQTSNYPLIFGSFNFNIGRDTHNTDTDHRCFSGNIDDIRIYNRALFQAEIKALYNQ